MSKSKASNIVRMEWLQNRTPTGKRSATKARKLAQYLAYGRGRPQEQLERPQRGRWLDQSGQIVSHEDVLQWVKEQGMENRYTRQFILSVKDAALTPEAFNRAMAAGGDLFSEWRLLQHQDSRYPHAHALAFGQEEVPVKSEAFRAWWLAVRAALEQERQTQMEQEKAQQQQLAQGLEQRSEQIASQQLGKLLSTEPTAVLGKQQMVEEVEELAVAEEPGQELEKSQQHGWGLGW
jgi:hypothetical protein